MTDEIIKFPQKNFVLKNELGHGACGQTVLLYDEEIEALFVCKKYSPIIEAMKAELFFNFVKEIKLLHLLYHTNIVRVFNYYIYPDRLLGYILMEYIEGTHIDEYLKIKPEQINQIFLQTIEGFFHLEENMILHRDIRPMNLMVSDEGVLKIIDFGFGKQAFNQNDYDKSITLNWWCEQPSEFNTRLYNFSTEVYFVGKLFEKIINDNQIKEFSYQSILSRMCKSEPSDRIDLFSKVRNEILTGKFSDINFSQYEKNIYREFVNEITAAISKIEQSTKYFDNPDEILRRLEEAYKKVMLESYVPENPIILKCFINGAYYYKKNQTIYVSNIYNFIELLKSCSKEKRNIIISNLHSRLDSIEKYNEEHEFDDDIPF